MEAVNEKTVSEVDPIQITRGNACLYKGVVRCPGAGKAYIGISPDDLRDIDDMVKMTVGNKNVRESIDKTTERSYNSNRKAVIMKKDKILEATLELAYEKGLGRVSMSQIAERAGLQKSSLYSHFSSKEEIIEKMYLYFREQAKNQNGNAETDYGKLVEGRSLREILTIVVNSYRRMNQNPQMDMFYRVIESERFINKMAADVMVSETKTMINATKQLFYAMQAKNIAEFPDPDGAAVSFAMGVHAILEYEVDSQMAESNGADEVMEQFIAEFSSRYQKEDHTL